MDQVKAANSSGAGVAGHILDRLVMPSSMPHYERGPVISHEFEWQGERWHAIFGSEHDGAGWRVEELLLRAIDRNGAT